MFCVANLKSRKDSFVNERKSAKLILTSYGKLSNVIDFLLHYCCDYMNKYKKLRNEWFGRCIVIKGLSMSLSGAPIQYGGSSVSLNWWTKLDSAKADSVIYEPAFVVVIWKSDGRVQFKIVTVFFVI